MNMNQLRLHSLPTAPAPAATTATSTAPGTTSPPSNNLTATTIRGARAYLFFDNGFLEEALADFRIACATRTRALRFYRFRIGLENRLGREASGTAN